jgi:hypothetical protein
MEGNEFSPVSSFNFSLVTLRLRIASAEIEIQSVPPKCNLLKCKFCSNASLLGPPTDSPYNNARFHKLQDARSIREFALGKTCNKYILDLRDR